ncbi:MAG TPA: acyl transferase [Flavisolibacter sp.]|nr:acyl transferase [Flavisolibacter sp.]
MNGEIPKTEKLEEKVFSISNAEMYDSIALEIYHFQYHNNPVYKTYCDLVNRKRLIEKVAEIPFLPISFFKTHNITTTVFDPELVFKSSGTTGMISSNHLVKHAGIYEESFQTCFKLFYGEAREYCILALLPSYLERGESSLVYMVRHLIGQSRHPQSNFYLYDLEKLHKTLLQLEADGQKTILIGVTYALLEFADKFPLPLNHTLVMETGGMKGKRREITKAELYKTLQNAFRINKIHSEYGMTELLSQAYGINGVFHTPPWMKVLLRDETDPLTLLSPEKPASGAINVIDLANLYSCSFIATEDIGRSMPDGGFEVLGRMDNTDIRGCSLLAL